MAVLTSRELLALRVALGIEREKLETFVVRSSDPHTQAGYRRRLETVEELIEKLAPGARVIVGD